MMHDTVSTQDVERRGGSVLGFIAAVLLAVLGFASLLPLFPFAAALFVAAIAVALAPSVPRIMTRAVLSASVVGLVLVMVMALFLTPVRTAPAEPAGPVESAPAAPVP